MSMGTAKSEQIKDSLGNVRYNRIPQKPLNPYVKSALLAALKQEGIDIKCEASAGTNVYEVYDANGKLLFVYQSAWDYGYYVLSIPDPKNPGKRIVVGEMDWYENDLNTNKEQQDIFDVSEALYKKYQELETIKKARTALSAEELQALQALGLTR